MAPDHPFITAWRELAERHPDPDRIRASELPELRGVNVFVKTDEWEKSGQVPGNARTVARLEGILFRDEDLDGDDRSLLRSVDRDVDFARVFLLEARRRPRPLWLCLSLGVIGVLLIVKAIKLFRGPRSSSSSASSAARARDEDVRSE